MNRSHLDNLIEVSTAAFDGRVPINDVRLPNPLSRSGVFEGHPFLNVEALWTADQLRPKWNNLAAVAQSIPNQDYVQPWANVLQELAIPLGLFSLGERNIYLIQSEAGAIKKQLIEPDKLFQELRRHSEALFSPQALGQLRTGQLSFASLEETVTYSGFSYLARHYADLSQSLQNAIEEALNIECERKADVLRDTQRGADEFRSTYDAVLMVAVAYLAARILEDKGYFGPEQLPTDDPHVLLDRTVTSINGFFKKALVDELPRLSDRALQHIAVHLGSGSTFTLVDHRQVGHLYEQAIQVMPASFESLDLDYGSTFADLQRHYTPVAIAERMVDLLPLERLRPEERLILDPAAGSGSLLLAATRRLSSMADTPVDKAHYLSRHVAGNDLDPRAHLITQLRYTLAREAEGSVFPAPYFTNQDFATFNHGNLPIPARVILANPPFAEDKNVQRAARFVYLMTSWLNAGDLFSLILPQSFLRGSTHGLAGARQNLAEHSYIFEVWQLPEGVVGLGAEQPVCIVLGQMGKNHGPTLARAVISRAKKQDVRDDGFLGKSWVTQLTADRSDWSEAVAPTIKIKVPTVPLGDLFYLFTGVTLDRRFPPIGELPKGVEVRRYWRREWKGKRRLWADPARADKNQRFIRYGREYLLRPRLAQAHLFPQPKVIVGRVANRDSTDPLSAHLDTSGLWPDNNVFCICPIEAAGKKVPSTLVPLGWQKLTHEDKLLWLLAILASGIGRELSTRRRESRHLTEAEFKKFELPLELNPAMIAVMKAIIARDREGRVIPDPDPLREELDQLVESAYGFPDAGSMVTASMLESWRKERQKPTLKVTGQVRDFRSGQVLVALDGIQDDKTEAWIELPPEMPAWALGAQIFTADLSDDIESFADLSARPWALRGFKHTPRPYLTIEELKDRFSLIASK